MGKKQNNYLSMKNNDVKEKKNVQGMNKTWFLAVQHCIINAMVRKFLWCVLVSFYCHQVHDVGGPPFNPSADKSPK